MDILLDCHPNHGGPTKEAVIQTMARMKLLIPEDLMTKAKKTKNKTELCQLLSTLQLDCKVSELHERDRFNCDSFFKSYEITKLLGSGSQGKVFEIIHRLNRKEKRVVKMFVNENDHTATSFQRELFFIKYL